MIHDLTHLHREADVDDENFWVLFSHPSNYRVNRATGEAIIAVASAEPANSNVAIRFRDMTQGLVYMPCSMVYGLVETSPAIRLADRSHNAALEREKAAHEATHQPPEWLRG